MDRFIPREKLSKKNRRKLDNRRRTTWSFSPITRKVENKKRYNRKQKAHECREYDSMSFLS